MSSRKIYVVGDNSGDYSNWMQGEITRDIKNADLVLFTGGEDVSPYLYNQLPHPYTCSNPHRDTIEVEYFKKARALNKHMIGICRGSQFLCVMNGGSLVQHQQNHSFIHPIDTYDGKTLLISSTHHQAAFPFEMDKSDYKILGWTNNFSKFHHGENPNIELNPPKECEIVYYPKTKCYGIQGHPEMMDIDEPEFAITIANLRRQLNMFLSNTLWKL